MAKRILEAILRKNIALLNTEFGGIQTAKDNINKNVENHAKPGLRVT